MIRSGYAMLPSLLFMTGCPSGQPSRQTVATIEAQLSRDPCLKNIKAMRRTYQFAKRGWKIDPNRIDISIVEAGVDGRPAGLFIVSREKDGAIDDRDYFGAYGTFVVSTNALDLWSCGMNMSGGFRHDPLY